MRTLAIVSDTHLPRRERALPAACIARLRAADLIVHAGDLVARSVLDQLRGHGEVAAVRGNIDCTDLRALLPEHLDLTVENVRLGVVHDAGPARGRLERLRRRFPEAQAVIFGHSHIPLLERDPESGFQIFNPGSPTDKRRQPHFTMGLAQISGDEIAFELITLG